jgi:hypothetical protein
VSTVRDSSASGAFSLSLDRARVYRALARLFLEPNAESVTTARERDLPELCQALERLSGDRGPVAEARSLCDLFEGVDLDGLRKGHHEAFDESSRTRCALTEMDQPGGPPQQELVRTFELADVAGFYKAFGVEVDPEGLRVDHLVTELDFMKGEGEHAQICHDASRVFLRDHLVRWAPALGERLAEGDSHPVYRAAGRVLRDFVRFDAIRIDADGAPVQLIDPTKQGERAPSP